MIVPVGQRVLEQACQQAVAWHQLGHLVTISVNISMRELQDEAFVDHVRGTISASGIEPDRLILEVSETSFMRNTALTIRCLKQLKEVGVGITVDDFGTGYSSLTYLRQLPIDALKICMRMNHKIAAVPIVEAEAPTPDQTDTDAKPKPVPNASRINERAAVTKPPAKTADHETPDEFASLLPTLRISRW